MRYITYSCGCLWAIRPCWMSARLSSNLGLGCVCQTFKCVKWRAFVQIACPLAKSASARTKK